MTGYTIAKKILQDSRILPSISKTRNYTIFKWLFFEISKENNKAFNYKKLQFNVTYGLNRNRFFYLYISASTILIDINFQYTQDFFILFKAKPNETN